MSAAEPLTMTLEEGLAAIFPDTIGRRDDGKWPFFTYMNDENGHTCTAIFDTWPEAVSWAKGVPIVAHDEAAELRAALKALLDPDGHDPAYDQTFGSGEPSKQAVNRARAALVKWKERNGE